MQDALSGLFDCGYGEARMRQLLLLLGSALDSYIKAQLQGGGLWREPFRQASVPPALPGAQRARGRANHL